MAAIQAAMCPHGSHRNGFLIASNQQTCWTVAPTGSILAWRKLRHTARTGIRIIGLRKSCRITANAAQPCLISQLSMRWFTPVAVVGLVVLLVLLSVLNFVQNSYTLITEFVENPNTTVTNGIWFKNWPSYLTSSVKPTCQPVNLPVNTQFFTNQSGLTWTIAAVSSNNTAAGVLPSLPYLNNVFEHCKMRQIRIDFDGSPDRLAQVSDEPAWDIQVHPTLTCGIWGPTGYSLLNLTAMYDADPPIPVAGSSQFVATSTTERASMYWAEALLSAYWVDTMGKLWEKSLALKPTIQKGAALLFPNDDQTDIVKFNFFNLTFNFPLSTDPQEGFGWHGPEAPVDVYIFNKQTAISTTPQIWKEVDSLAKAIYSASMTDLGQARHPSQSNIVTNATTIQHFSSSFSDIALRNTLYYTQLTTKDYNSRQQSGYPTGALGLTPSVISTRYLCQVPKRRNFGEIFISVLLADLVLLQAAWKLYTFGVDQFFLRRYDKAKFCEGHTRSKIIQYKDAKGGVIMYVGGNSEQKG